MTEKNKRQLRAEAMERLKNNVGARFMPDAAIIAIVGGRVGQSDWSLECDRLIDLLTDDDSHEERESYEERMYDVPVSDCPYCGCDRVVIHDYNDSYERPHSYRVEHVSEKEAFNEGCFTSYYAFDSVEKAVKHADERNEWRCIGECADANDTLAAENDVSAASADANDVNAMQDSREKLEADIRKYRNEHCETSGRVAEWLDRQAAITEAEQREWWGGVVAEVQAKVDELTAELTAARNAHAQAEHEAVILREKLGRALDYAHEITSVGGDC